MLIPLLSLLPFLPLSLAANPELLIARTLTHTCTRQTKNGDTVNMHYRGTLQSDGKEFDASYKRGTPLSFQLGAGRVIKGWDLGLLDMCPGDKRTLTIPPELGYGSRGMGPIPGEATLVFETELVSISGVEEEPRVLAPDAEADKPAQEMTDKINEAIKEEAKEEVKQKAEAEESKKEEAKTAETEASKAEPAEPAEAQNPQEEAEKEKKEEEKEEVKDEL